MAPKGTLPGTGVTAKLFKSGTLYGYCQGLTSGAKADIIKEWALGDSSPKLLKRGPASYPFTIDNLFTDYSFVTHFLGNTTCTIVIAPGAGSKTGEAKITMTNARITDWELTITEDGPVLERVAGEAEGFATGTY